MGNVYYEKIKVSFDLGCMSIYCRRPPKKLRTFKIALRCGNALKLQMDSKYVL